MKINETRQQLWFKLKREEEERRTLQKELRALKERNSKGFFARLKELFGVKARV